METKHTPGPWAHEIIGYGVSGKPISAVIRNLNGYEVASEVDPDDAAFIVRVCNSHYDLLAVCEEMVKKWDGKSPLSWQPDGHYDSLNKMRAAVKRAKGET